MIDSGSVGGRPTDREMTTVGLDDDWIGQTMSAAIGGTADASFAGFVGTGQMSRVARFTLDWVDGEGPASTLVKLPSAVASTRDMAFDRALYGKECEFYRTVAPGIDVATPQVFHVHHDPDRLDFAVVMEDCTSHAAGDQLSAASIDDIEAALVQAAALHAGCWLRTDDDELAIFREDVAEAAARSQRGFPIAVDSVLGRWGDRIEPDVAEFVTEFSPHIEVWRHLRSLPITVAHGDYRPDNILFGPADDARRVIPVDWQLATIGLPSLDVAFLIGGALTPDERYEHERRMIDVYLAALRGRGVEIDTGDYLSGHALATAHGVVVAISAAATVDRTERGEDLLSMMCNRHGRHAIDWKALDVIASAPDPSGGGSSGGGSAGV